jgi:hypothetical protein
MRQSVKDPDPSRVKHINELNASTQDALKAHLDQVDALLTQENLEMVVLEDGESLKAAVDVSDE